MLVGWYPRMIVGSLLMGMIYCQDNNPLSIDNEPDVTVVLSVDTLPKSSVAAANAPEPFACHECVNCQDKSNITTRTCHFDINMCFTTMKRMNDTIRVVRRGCSTAKEQCIVPNDEHSNTFDSVTCCKSHKCNGGIQFQPLFFLLIFTLFIGI